MNERRPIKIDSNQPKKEVVINPKEVLNSERQDMRRRIKKLLADMDIKFDKLEKLIT